MNQMHLIVDMMNLVVYMITIPTVDIEKVLQKQKILVLLIGGSLTSLQE